MVKTPIFYYHSVGPAGPETLDIAIFKEHLTLIRELGFTPLSFQQLMEGRYPQGIRPLVLTFDDGLLDNYENVLPLLVDYGYPASFFVVPGYDRVTRWVNPRTRQWSDTPQSGFSLPFKSMQKQHRRAMLECGMEIGSHSMTHHKLNQLSAKQLEHEIGDSKKFLEDELGVAIPSFCYPMGRYNEAVIDCLQRAGYQGACTTIPGFYHASCAPFECGRFIMKNVFWFRTILHWVLEQAHWPEMLCRALYYPLSFKNRYL